MCIHVYIYTCIYIYTYTYEKIQICLHEYECIVYIYIHVHIGNMYICIYTHAHGRRLPLPRRRERMRRAPRSAHGTAVAAPHTAPIIACMFLMYLGSGVSLIPTMVIVANCGFGSVANLALTALKIFTCVWYL